MLIRTLIAWETAAVTLELAALPPAAAPLTRDSGADSRVNGLFTWARMARSRGNAPDGTAVPPGGTG